jgi:hypothetical protein
MRIAEKRDRLFATIEMLKREAALLGEPQGECLVPVAVDKNRCRKAPARPATIRRQCDPG